MPKREKLVIIDGNALLHRAWHALPPLTTKSGELVNAVYGFSMILIKVIKDLKPTHLAVTFDLAAPTFRHEEFKEYKAQREKQPDELYNQIPRCREVAEAFNIPIYEKKGFEADDVIGTICNHLEVNKRGMESVVVTGDLDTLQLVDNNTKVFTLKKGIADTIIYDEKAVEERYDLKPSQLIDYKALAGDPSDNIPGVNGVGVKTAQDLIKKFGSLDNLYQELEKKTAKAKKIKERVRNLLWEQKKEAYESQKLVTIVRDVPIEFDLEGTRLGEFDQAKIFKLFQELEFRRLLNQIQELIGKEQGSLFGVSNIKHEVFPASLRRQAGEVGRARMESVSGENRKIKENDIYILIDTMEKFEGFLKELKRQKEFAVDTETTNLDPFRAKMIGLSFSWRKGEAYYVINEDKFIKELKPIFENSKIEKIGHNIKYDKSVLRSVGVRLEGVYFDTMIASYVLHPGSRGHSLDNLAFTEFGHQMIPIESLIGKKGKNQFTLDQLPLERVAEYAAEDADYTWQLYSKLAPELTKATVEGLFYEIEMPLVDVLEEVEFNGVKIDGEFLKKMSKKVELEIRKLEARIFEMAGVEFNVNSPLQLKEILFKKLKIWTQDLKRIKTGISTAASELEKMKGAHPIIEPIIKHRELAKLKNTYLDALPLLVNPHSGRVHTSFNQTVTATGRLSSSDPNLQNIPIRTELGQEIRKAFIAERGFKILAADYSQIELRVIASLAKDRNMIEVFNNGEDVHSATAARIFEVDLGEVTKDMRRKAKEVNFGVIYGMGAYGLSQRTGLSREEAGDFIEKYFEVYADIKDYLEETIALAHEMGYVETIFGRRRYLPEINSGVVQIRNAAERMAVNMPIQGTAADLMKKAMIKIHRGLPKISPKSKMILQVHDELVFEVPKEEIKKVAQFVESEMVGVAKLRVPVEVDLEVGDNWGELENLEKSE